MSKYRSIRVKEDGIFFDSKAELARYRELRFLVFANEIWELRVHPQYPLDVSGVRVGIYTPDFAYRPTGAGHVVCEDVKGVRTTDYVLRSKLFKALYPGIDFKELNTDKSATRKAWTKFAAGRGIQTAAGGGK